MSVTLMKEILEDTELTPNEKLVGMAIASRHWESSPENGCRVQHLTTALARMTGLHLRVVQRTIKDLEGRRLRVERPTKTTIGRVWWMSRVTTPQSQGCDSTVVSCDSPVAYKDQEEQEQPQEPTFAARTGPEGEAQMNVGMPDDLERDEQERKPMRRKPGDPPPPGTFKRCEVEFHNRVLDVLGKPQYDIGFLRGVISGLHRGDYGRVCSYQEIHEVVIPMYFVRNEEYLRANRDQINVVKHFVSQINHGLLNQAEPGMRRAGGPSLREKILARKQASA